MKKLGFLKNRSRSRRMKPQKLKDHIMGQTTTMRFLIWCGVSTMPVGSKIMFSVTKFPLGMGVHHDLRCYSLLAGNKYRWMSKNVLTHMFSKVPELGYEIELSPGRRECRWHWEKTGFREKTYYVIITKVRDC